MKKYLALLVACGITINVYTKHEVFSRSFMFTKPAGPVYDIVTQQSLWHDIVYNKKGPIKAGIQITPFLQRSTSLKKSARYFLIKGKTTLLVSGDDNVDELAIRDVRAEWLGLPGNFSGNLTMNPQQQQYGCAIEYNQDLKKWCDIAFIRDMYISIIFPIINVENSLRLEQFNVVNESPTPPQNIIQAFNQPSWEFSRIVNHKKRTGVADIKILLGTSYISEDYIQLNYYSALIIPTAKKQHAQIMFDPVVGNNHHMGVGGGVNFQVPLNKNIDTHVFSWFMDLETIILIRNKQYRTFDLRYPDGTPNEWSRFMLMNVQGGEPNTNIPGVNLLTRKAVVKPFSIIDFAMGWRVNRNNMEFETGWGIWGHSWERVEHVKKFKEVFGIAGREPGTTAHRSTIAQQAPDDTINGIPFFVPITRSDLDMHSGASKSSLDFKVFMNGGIVKQGKTIDSLFGGGWSIDIPYINSMLQIWTVWLKGGITF